MSWIGDLWDSVVDTATETFAEDSIWTDIATEAVSTALVGAGVGALAAAVTDGDMAEGMLFGAAGGLVAGGLMEFGSQYMDNWNWSSSIDAATGGYATEAGVASIPSGEYLGTVDLDISQEFLETAPIETLTTAVTEKSPLSDIDVLNRVFKPEVPWYKSPEVIAAGMQIGGGFLQGAFAGEDPAVAEQRRQFDIQRQRTEEAEQRRREALGAFEVAEGAYAPGVSVAEQVQRRGLVGFSKEAAGVTV